MDTDRRLGIAYFAVLGVGCVAVAAVGTALRPGPYKLLDWAINYEGGFVRRGLTGQAFLIAERSTGVSIALQVSITVAALYAVILWAVYRLWARGGYDGRFALLIAAPFFLLFPIASYHGAGRKEILFLAAFALLCLAASRATDPRRLRRGFLLFALVMPAIVLAHEATAFFLGLPLTLARVLGMRARDLGILAIAAVPTLLALALVTFGAITTSDQIADICGSLQGPLGAPALAAECAVTDNAVTWLMRDFDSAIASVTSFLPDYLMTIGPALILISIAFVPLRHLIASDARPLTMGMTLACLFCAPLFVAAIDWGRFLHVLSSGLAMILLTLRARAPLAASDRPAAPGVAVVGIYALGWNLSYLGPLVGGGLVAEIASRVLPLAGR